MNRETRRELIKNGAYKKTVENLGAYQSPCTLAEAVQISRASAEDVVASYDQSIRPLQVAVSLQVELLKKVIIKSGLVSEEEFKDMYINAVKEFNDTQRASLEEDNEDPEETSPKMSASVSDIEVKVD